MVYNISDSKEGVEDRNDYAEQVDMLKDSKILVVDGSNPKSDQSLGTQTTNGISATDTTNGIVYVMFDLFFFLVHDAEKSFFEILT